MSPFQKVAIHSKKGFFSSIQISLILTGSTIAIAALMISITNRDVALLWQIGFLFFGGLGYWLSLHAFTVRYCITLEGIDMKHIWGKRFISWQEISAISVISNYFGSYNIQVFIHGKKRPFAIYASFIGNRKVLGQAILEAASLSNPSIQFKGVFDMAYGTPPFGIFANERKKD